MPLDKIDNIVTRFMENKWVRITKHCRNEEEMIVRLELRILGLFKVLGHYCPFRTLKSDTNISTCKNRAFFHFSIDCMYGIHHEFVDYPSSEEELDQIMNRYEENYLPGCGGSVDVVHVKLSKCPAGDVNHAKGKEGFPSLAFEVVMGFDRQILGVSKAHFGTPNDKQIMQVDETIQLVKNGWYRDVEWKWYIEYGNKETSVGVYLLCDGGYLHWPELICPFKHEPASSRKGYFSAKIESVRKDVECIFGIMKKRWKILDNGIRISNMQVVEEVFTVCCMLHNNMLMEMESRDCDVRVGRGAPIKGDGIWLRGNDQLYDDADGPQESRALAAQWSR
jgi:hypothetical protein